MTPANLTYKLLQSSPPFEPKVAVAAYLWSETLSLGLATNSLGWWWVLCCFQKVVTAKLEQDDVSYANHSHTNLWISDPWTKVAGRDDPLLLLLLDVQSNLLLLLNG
jgi:hypothetical protein